VAGGMDVVVRRFEHAELGRAGVAGGRPVRGRAGAVGDATGAPTAESGGGTVPVMRL